jgi:predicted 2-oxoglutarate/Fe(II)-dependent dioxygenase YbiX
MEVYSQFFNAELHKELYEYAKNAYYRRVEDGKYNFKKSQVSKNLERKVQKTLKQHNIYSVIDSLRVQCIDTSITVAESFHTHNLLYKDNLVCFLNDDFTGGEFEYTSLENTVIKPTTNTALVFRPELAHRVLPVTQGARYTLVAFLVESSYITKEEKTLI